MTKQQQRSGDDSANYQAGRDIVVVGVSASEARQIALDVFKANMPELIGAAQQTAASRAEEITNEFLAKLAYEAPQALNQLRDPDVQNSLATAQIEYAKSGEEDVGHLLVDLLSARVQEEDRGLRTLALNEALKAAPKLTEDQRRAIALVFLARHTRTTDILADARSVAAVWLQNLLRLPSGTEPLREVDFQHIAYVGAGALSISELRLGDAIAHTQQSAFTRGIPIEMISDEVMDSPFRDALLMPCFRDPTKWQFRVAADQDVDDLIDSVGAQHLRDRLQPLRNSGLLEGREVTREIVAALPESRSLFDEWDTTSLKRLELTSVGIAIGHAYWHRFGGTTALDVWL